MDSTFAENIIEMKIISDRLVQGVGKNAGVFSVKYQIIYLVEKKGINTPKKLIEELSNVEKKEKKSPWEKFKSLFK